MITRLYPNPERKPPDGEPTLPDGGGEPPLPAGIRPAPKPRHRGESPRAGSRRTTLALWAFIAVGCVAIGGLTFFVLATPTDLIRDEIVREVKARTGRDMVIAGPTSLRFIPSLGVAMSDVSVSAPPGMTAGPTVTVRSIDAKVAIWPLLSRNVVIERLELREPVVDLRIDAQGRRSWDQALLGPSPADGARRVRLADIRLFRQPRADNAAAPRGSPLDDLNDLTLEELRVIGGTVRFTDERAKLSREAKAIDLTVSIKGLTQPLKSGGSLVMDGEKVEFTSEIAPFRSLVEQQPAEAKVRITGATFEAGYNGRLTVREAIELDGKLTASAPDLDRLFAHAGRRAVEPIGAGKLSAQLKSSATLVSLADLALSAGGIAATGAVTVETKGARPLVKGQLKVADLDVNRILVLASNATPPPPAAATPPAAPGRGGPRSIDDILKRDTGAPSPPQTQVRGYTKRGGWSEDVIDLAPLGAVDADLALAFDRIVYRDVKTGAGRITLALKDKVASVTAAEFPLYEGRGRALVTVDGSGDAPRLAINIAADDISALPLLKDAAELDWLAGKGRIALNVAGRGTTERQIIETLAGRAEVALVDGAVVGFNAAQIIRGLAQGRTTGFERIPTEKTDFSELAATFEITNGVAQNQDLRLASPLMRAGGSGTVDLVQRQIDYTVRPKLVANLTGQGGPINISGLEIPVRIQGPWEKPAITTDLDAVLKDPNQAANIAKEIGKAIDSKEVEDVFKGLFGGGNAEQKNKARDFLRGIFGR